jgi:hypothetical protein
LQVAEIEILKEGKGIGSHGYGAGHGPENANIREEAVRDHQPVADQHLGVHSGPIKCLIAERETSCAVAIGCREERN